MGAMTPTSSSSSKIDKMSTANSSTISSTNLLPPATWRQPLSIKDIALCFRTMTAAPDMATDAAYERLMDHNFLNNVIDEVHFRYITVAVTPFINIPDDDAEGLIDFALKTDLQRNSPMGSLLTKPQNVVFQWVHYILERIQWQSDPLRPFQVITANDQTQSQRQLRVCSFGTYS